MIPQDRPDPAHLAAAIRSDEARCTAEDWPFAWTPPHTRTTLAELKQREEMQAQARRDDTRRYGLPAASEYVNWMSGGGTPDRGPRPDLYRVQLDDIEPDES